jgi:endonuclease YncB( thermonuclease family)
VEVKVAAVEDPKQVSGDVRFLGVDLALDLLRQGAAREDLSGRDPIPEDPLPRALAEHDARMARRGAWGKDAGIGIVR